MGICLCIAIRELRIIVGICLDMLCVMCIFAHRYNIVMNDIREKCINRRMEEGLRLEDVSSEGCSRFTISRFEKGGDIGFKALEILMKSLCLDTMVIKRPFKK